MELYIEKEFLDNFYIEDDNSNVNCVVKNLFSQYGDKSVFMDVTINSVKDLIELKQNNELFALICATDKIPIPIVSIKDHVFNHSSFEQTLIFMNEDHKWFAQAQKKGALCFNFSSYKEDIENIIENVHFRIDLSEGFEGWNSIEAVKYVPLNKINFIDGFILTDKDNQKIKRNVVPLLECFLDDADEVKVNILTKIPGHNDYTIRRTAEKRYTRLNSEFAKKKVKFSIFSNLFAKKNELHDRVILTNFSLLQCGMGFNLNGVTDSNSELSNETIFSKYTYNRLRRLQEKTNIYIDKLASLESINFKHYP